MKEEQTQPSERGSVTTSIDPDHLVVITGDSGLDHDTAAFPEAAIGPEHLRSEEDKVLGSGVRERYQKIAVGLAASDALCVCVALFAGWFIRWQFRPLNSSYVLIVASAPLLWVAVFRAFGLYSPQHINGATEFRRTLGATSLGMLLVMVVSFWSKASFSRGWVAISWLVAFLLEVTVRHAWRSHEARLKLDGRLAYRTLIIGTNQEAARLSDSLRQPNSGFAPLGYVSLAEGSDSPNGLAVLGHLDALPNVIRRHSADCLFVASSALGSDEMLRIATAARQEGTEMRVSANLPEILSSRLTVQPVGGSLALTIKPVRLTGAQQFIKRSFDLTCASLALLITAPLLAVIAIAIRVSSPGPALFRQERVTQGGRTFTAYKFRTMVRHADTIRLETSPDPTSLYFKPQSDPRLTSIGRLLRRSSLDELPQLFNVIRGEMSLVGPRPLPVEQIAANLDLLGPRHEVPAGLTGWWQINGRSDLGPEESLRLDLFYIENWSPTLDLYIVLKTVQVLITGKGAY